MFWAIKDKLLYSSGLPFPYQEDKIISKAPFNSKSLGFSFSLFLQQMAFLLIAPYCGDFFMTDLLEMMSST